jgi:hypothetical protein
MSKKLYAIGDIVRYTDGSTALMQITYISVGHGGSIARYYGIQCMGGYIGAYHGRVNKANAQDLKKWNSCKKWRNHTPL